MRYTVHYIPLSKIKNGPAVKMTRRIRELRLAASDFMHLLVVRKINKQGGYIVVSGQNHYDYYKRYTKKKSVACLVDESRAASGWDSFMSLFRIRNAPLPQAPYLTRDRMPGSSMSIIRAFLKQEPRFKQLSRRQQLKVIRLGLQYKKTTVKSMKEKTNVMLRSKS